MRSYDLVESEGRLLPLTEAEAEALEALGARLASNTTWWGATDDPEAPSTASVIRCSRIGAAWNVRVADAIGLVALGDLQLVVHPKIPTRHLLHLFEAAGVVPRLSNELGALAEGEHLWDLLARWFVGSTERLLRRDLLRDYRPVVDHLQVVRGRIALLPTARAIYSGRLLLECEFDEFSRDTPLNRILRASAQAIAGNSTAKQDIRRRAVRIVTRMDEVTALAPSDLDARIDRHMASYSDAVALAKIVLRGAAVSLAAGLTRAWTFLIRTPEPAESGIRALLTNALHDHHVAKTGLLLSPSHLTLNPDLVFDGGDVVADVKYKRAGLEWRRSDLYQVVAFAAAYHARKCAIIDFATNQSPLLPRLRLGEIDATAFSWLALDSTHPKDAEELLTAEIRAWLA